MHPKSLIVALVALLSACCVEASLKRFIVVFKSPPTIESVKSQIAPWGGNIVHAFTLIPAVTIELPASLSHWLKTIKDVDYVEEDEGVHALVDGESEEKGYVEADIL
ncbi:hypothetical protein BCR33DRAFT_844828 [Rhizoclosmatium globosum]|uniref:Inhibitor I9 domain-containing protein n=1 Tax=Rhizoclosmatium globosum TaxID=329046 RepID=A0A1Y2D4K6_9FUNG|nr:hypothetical protein HDU79_002986 [Rhizoclosmatium sp. JEL0117]ORY53515.1 hypothetical protein BCR33DRAFT_844828 [Rhizoclosmatium globosum]|eukprot:ORY53515.1 hypothetical protein BCR33DRAFT_844828 [Rhizoclosmatium globosum]